MTLWGKIKNWFTASEAQGLEEKARGLVAGVPSVWGRGQKAPFSFQTCFERYENVGLVTAAVDATAEMIAGPGYHTEGVGEAKRVVDDFAEEVNLDGLLMDAVLDCAICGNSWVEKVVEDGLIVGLNYLDPLSMEQSIILKKAPGGFDLYHNQVEGYVQTVRGRKTAQWPADRIIHFTWNRPRGSLYGTGMVKPVEAYLQTILEAEQDMGKIIKRYAAPKVAWMLQDAGKTVFDEVKRQLRTVQPDEDYVIATTGKTRIDAQVIQIDPRSRFEYFFNHITNAIMAGLECPITFLFRGDVRVSDASATAMLQAFDRKIRMKQRRFKRIIEAQLFRPLVRQHGHSEVPRLVWGPVEVETLEDKLKKWTELLSSRLSLRDETRRALEDEMMKDLGLQSTAEERSEDA
ncbi:hypothetical protein [Candidatus Hecatella orcuttiae]|jgi:hypothetical protein|uniref:hypothetical protein n=1 Tax=Candidatus Hecatella orcuttiae TaxID=1935119 RepID=UPI002867DAB5|nr:hypothetical protein [Candidatus Hecatella orcuttiae]